jgi:pyruvate/2-oxoacid:ferredoxin oxidoreductase beta subunit
VALVSGSDRSIKTVKTNYFPLWEAEYGKFKLTTTVANPEPITKYVKMFRKFNHLGEKELAVIQEEVNQKYAFLKHLTEFGEHGQTTEQTAE